MVDSHAFTARPTPRSTLAVLLPHGSGWRSLPVGDRLVLGAAAVPGRLEAPGVADRHCALEPAPGGLRVIDFGAGPTLVGNRPATGRQALAAPGDVIRLGRAPVVVIAQRQEADLLWSGIGQFGSWSTAMLAVLAQTGLLAQSTLPVLITGETGTGKEWAARALHDASPRADRPLVAVNCGALHGDLLLAELFGAERGAYTGCTERRRGAFERADGGTLLLDEVGELPLPAQAALLRALETGEIQVLGGASRKVDVRLICATHRDLYAAAQRGTFRLDLLHRVEVASLRLPPLRDRPEDIVGLLSQWWAGLDVDPQIVARLQTLPLPGNLRELRNLALRLEVTARFGVPTLQDLHAELCERGHAGRGAGWGADGQDLLPQGLSTQQAWRASGLSRSTFYRRLRELRSQSA